ncbi:hypothetical protein MKX03_012448, partial [Papaver bracteatum]
LLKIIISSLHSKETSPSNATDQDVAMADASGIPSKGSNGARNINFVEVVSKTSVVKQPSDLKGSSIKVLNYHDSVIYILAPLQYATVYGCSDATVVLGEIGQGMCEYHLTVIRVEHCERVQVITAEKRICIANCHECVFFLGVNQRPVFLGDNHKLQVAPYNTFYPQLGMHMTQVSIDANINKWDEHLVLGMVDPHDLLCHHAGVSDVQADSVIPNWFGDVPHEATKHNPFPLPEVYMTSQQKNYQSAEEIKQALRNLQLEDNKKRELSNALHLYFKDWFYASGNIRHLYYLQGD